MHKMNNTHNHDHNTHNMQKLYTICNNITHNGMRKVNSIHHAHNTNNHVHAMSIDMLNHMPLIMHNRNTPMHDMHKM